MSTRAGRPTERAGREGGLGGGLELWTHPADAVAVLYHALLVFLILALAYHAPRFWAWFLAHLVIMGLLVACSNLALRLPPGPRVWFRFTYGAAFIVTSFMLLGYYITALNPNDQDRLLLRLDLMLTGGHPTLWLEPITRPWLTELLQWVYATYYFLPLVLTFLLWRRGERRAVHVLLVALTVGFYLSYLGYVLVPAVGPRYLLAGEYRVPLDGVFAARWIYDTLDTLENIKRDCFPSAHTAISLIVLWYAARHHRRSLVFFVPVISALVFSTVYLRYHYVIDLVAALPLAALAVGVAPAILARWEREPSAEEELALE